MRADSVGPAIFAEGETIDELKENIRGGIDCYYLNPEEKTFSYTSLL